VILLRDASVLLERRYRLLVRQPIWIAIMLVQPLVWLLLCSQLLGRLPELTDAGAGSYIEFLAPGVVVASAFSHGAWDGTTTVSELEHGTFERFLATPLVPSAPLVAQLAQAALTGAAQGLVVLLTALGLGVRVHVGVAGWAIVLAAAALAAAAFAGVSHALTLLLRRRSAGRSPPPVARPSPTPTGGRRSPPRRTQRAHGSPAALALAAYDHYRRSL
jgi:ABC-2 type transport system permease protein